LGEEIMGVADREGAGPRQVLTGIVVGLFVVSCIVGWGAAVSIIQPQYRYIPDIVVVTTTQESRGISYVACGQGCTCLSESGAQARFGTGYVRCSEYSCGSETSGNGDLVFTIPKYCYQAQQRIVSYAACGQGCQCLMASEAQVQFGADYTMCSATACGQDHYCYRAQRIISYAACGQGCTCLTGSEAQAQFGGNYVKCSAAACGQNSFCYKAQELPMTGGLSLKTIPSGATVVFDNVNRGTTPVTLTGLSPGSHTVRFSLAGYQEQTETVSVSAGQTGGYTFGLSPIAQAPPAATTSGLSLKTIPSGATVVFDSVNRGTTPVTLTGLTPGSHTVRFSLAGYQDQNEPVTVTAGQTVGYTYTLTPERGYGGGQGVSQVAAVEPQVGVVNLADDKQGGASGQAVGSVDQMNKLNPQPEPPKPADYNKLNPQTEPPGPASKGFFDSIISYFTGLFGWNTQNTYQTAPRADGSIFPSLQLPWDTPCSGTGAERCNGRCANTQSDPDNCGACGNKCNPEQICSGGTCSSLYPAGMKPQGGKSIAYSAAMPAIAEHAGVLNTCTKCHDTGSGNADTTANQWVAKDGTPLSRSLVMPAIAEHVGVLNTCTKCHSTQGTGSGTGNAGGVPWVIKDSIPPSEMSPSVVMPETAEHLIAFQTCTKCHDTGSGNADTTANQWVAKDGAPLSEMSPSVVMPETAEHLIAFQTCTKCHDTGSGNADATAIQWVAKDGT
jgi:hypothetical protein